MVRTEKANKQTGMLTLHSTLSVGSSPSHAVTYDEVDASDMVSALSRSSSSSTGSGLGEADLADIFFTESGSERVGKKRGRRWRNIKS